MLDKVIEFKFGDSVALKSLKQDVIPCFLAEKQCMLKTDVVSSTISLLLGKPSIKKKGYGETLHW